MTTTVPKLVQPIAVLPGTHHETIAAVAIASARATIRHDINLDPWRAWLSGSFTKSVRRVRRAAHLDQIRLDPDAICHALVGDAVAIAYRPMPYDDFPKQLSRLRVSGLDRRDDAVPDSWSYSFDRSVRAHAPQVVLNRSVDMTTGKAAAQVAHAMVLWSLAVPEGIATTWADDPTLHLSTADLDTQRVAPEGGRSIIVRDNGLTEVDPGTITARINLD